MASGIRCKSAGVVPGFMIRLGDVPVIWPQMADTVDLEIAAWSPSASARVASTSRTGRPRMNEAITRDSSALVMVTWLPNRREAKASLAPRSLGRASSTGLAVALTVTSRTRCGSRAGHPGRPRPAGNGPGPRTR